MSSFARPSSRLPAWLLLAGILLVAVNLRPAISAVGPVLPVIGEDVGLGSTALGVLAAVPIVAFAVVSPVVHPLARRFGVERTVAGSLAVLAAGTVLRSAPGPAANLWLGTALIGATIAVGNVLLPVVVKKDFPLRVPATTAWYVAAQSVLAATASGVAVPLAGLGGWQFAVGIWVLLVGVALAAWVPRLREARRLRTSEAPARALAGRTTPPAAGNPPAAAPSSGRGSVYRQPLAWLVAVYMGLQSTIFYITLNWMPTVEQDLGIDPAVAGWHLFSFLAVGIAGNLAVPTLMRVGGDQRLAASLISVLSLIAVAGIWLAPGLIWLWVPVIGVGTGSAFVVALSLVSLRAADPATASQLSAMSQAVGYTITALGLVLAGVLRDLTGPGTSVLLLVAVVGLVLLAVGLSVGRNRTLRA